MRDAGVWNGVLSTQLTLCGVRCGVRVGVRGVIGLTGCKTYCCCQNGGVRLRQRSRDSGGCRVGRHRIGVGVLGFVFRFLRAGIDQG